jgi:WD40 repeat protein
MAVAPTLLEYASPAATREPWGPILFRLSWRSVFLFVLAAAAVTWLALRHEPWRMVGTIAADYRCSPLFTSDNRILAFDTREGVNLYDPATGRRIRNVLPSIDTGTYRYFVQKNGEQILALPYTERTALLYDVASGRVVERLPNPDRLGSLLVAVAPDGPRVISREQGHSGGPPSPKFYWWNLSGRRTATQPTLFPFGGMVSFSPDGGHLLGRGGDGRGIIVADGHTLQIIARVPLPRPTLLTQGNFADADHILIVADSPRGELVTILSARTGAVLSSVTTDAPSAFFVLSDDAQLLASMDYSARSSSIPPRSTTIEIREATTGKLLWSHGALYAWSARFFPRSHRLLAGNEIRPALAIIDATHDQPLAVLSSAAPQFGIVPAPEISQDGETIVTAGDELGKTLALYRQTGWDCSESHLGALVFPQTWLTVVLFAALCTSLARDARRARPASVNRPPSSVVTTGLLLIAVVVTLYFVLTAALGRWTLTPAPLLLVAAMGLFTHSRAWRAITLWLMAGMLPVSLLLAYRVYRSGVWSASVWPVLDRYYSIPHIAPFVGLCAAGAVLPIGIFFLSRPRTVGA